MSLTLRSFSRLELISLIEHAGMFAEPEALKAGWRAVVQARLAEAEAARQRLYDVWLPLSRTATIDAQAAREWIERRGYDEGATSLLQGSKRSTRAAAEAWEEVRAAGIACEKLARQLRLVGRL